MSWMLRRWYSTMTHGLATKACALSFLKWGIVYYVSVEGWVEWKRMLRRRHNNTLITLKSNDATRPRDISEIHIDELLELVVELKVLRLAYGRGLPPIYRVDGDLLPGNYTKCTRKILQRMSYDILTDEQIQRFENDMELDFSYQLGKSSRFRVNIFRDRGSVAAAFRTIPYKIPTMEDLGLPEVVKELTKKHRGLILVTGPTGSGKSTTLAAMVGEINRNYRTHIITIEDPIEYLHTHR